jgi:hypothetical protein
MTISPIDMILNAPGFSEKIQVMRFNVGSYNSTGKWIDNGYTLFSSVTANVQKADRKKYPEIQADGSNQVVVIISKTELLTTNEDTGQRADHVLTSMSTNWFEVIQRINAAGVDISHFEFIAQELKVMENA